MNSTISNYAQVKENTGWHLALDRIGSVLVQRARKWDRDHKQIQIAAVAFRDCGWPALQTEYSNRFWFREQHKGDGPAGDMRGKAAIWWEMHQDWLCRGAGVEIIKPRLCQRDAWRANQTARLARDSFHPLGTLRFHLTFLWKLSYSHILTLWQPVNIVRFFFQSSMHEKHEKKNEEIHCFFSCFADRTL